MAVLKILFFLAAVQIVHPKPFLFKEVKLKKNFEFSLKPVLKPLTFITEFMPVKIKHAVAKRSPSPIPPSNLEPSPAPLFKIDLEKSIEIKSVPTHKEEEINKQPPPHVGPPPGHPKAHEEIHVQHFHETLKPPPVGKLLTRVDIDPAVLPPESHERHLPPHVRFPPVSPPPHEGHVDYVRESRLSVSPPPLGPHIPQVSVGHEHHLLVEPKKEVTGHPGIVHEGPFSGVSESSRVIHGHPPPPPPLHLDKITPLPSENGNQGTLEAFFEPRSTGPVGIKEPVHFPDVPPHHTSDLHNEVTRQDSFPVFPRPPPEGIQEELEEHHHMPVLPHQVTGQGSFPVPNFARPPPAGIQEKPVPQRSTGLPEQGTFPGFVRPFPPEIQESNKPPRSPLLTDISRADEISAYLKAIDALPLVKPPLEENVLLLAPGNSVEPTGPKETVENKADASSLARGSRLALYFGNILLQVMSQAIGSARSAIGQYSMPKVF